MKNKNLKKLFYFVVSHLTLIFAFAVSISAQTTAFNYQGKLSDNGAAQNTYQMQFKLFDALAVGNQIGATIPDVNVTVNQGVFNVLLDFGANVFTGADRFLEIAVRRNAGEAYTVLTPRQQIASSPYSIRTLSAAQADLSLDSNKLGGIDASEYVTTSSIGNSFIKNATTLQTGNFNINGNGFLGGNFGIGTTTPTSKLQVQTNGYGITQTDGTVTIGSYINPTGGWFGTRTNHPLYFFTNDSQQQMTLLQNGNVGIGTTTPATKLQVFSTGLGVSAIYGESSSGRGVWGKSTGGSRGVYGESVSGQGVFGISTSGQGVFGASASNSGVYGETQVSSLTAGGVYGKGIGSGSIGVIGEANVDNAVGVYGTSTSTSGFGVYARNPTQPGGITGGNGKALYVDGNAGQSLSGNGIVKVMIHVDRTGSIVSCFNGVASALMSNCGAVVITKPLAGVYRINFGFPVTGRFVSITPEYGTTCNVNPIQCRNAGANFRFFDANQIEVFTFDANNRADTADAAFMLIMY